MKDGKIFYQGETSDIVSDFSRCGLDIPANFNPADYALAVLHGASEDGIFAESAGDIEMVAKAPKAGSVDSIAMPNPPEWLVSFVAKATAEKNGVVISFSQSMRDKFRANEDKPGILESTALFWKQLSALAHREAISQYRDTAALIGRFGVTIFLNILYGLIFLNAGGGNNGNVGEFQAHFGAITMIMISGMFGSAQPTMLSFPFERPMFLREYNTGTYRVAPYFISKAIVEAFLALLTSLVQLILVYFMVDLQGRFVVYLAALWMLGLCSCSLAMCLGCTVKDVKSVTELAPLLFVPQLLFVGFFTPTEKIPIFLRWVQYLCGLKYAMNLVLLTEFAPSQESCTESAGAAQNCANVITSNKIDGSLDAIVGYVGALVAIYIGFRVLGAYILAQKSKTLY